jgi:hypothetical protein
MTTTILRQTMHAAAAAMFFIAAAGRTVAEEARGAQYEVSVKSAFLYHFARFVQWPERADTAADAPLVIGVLGADPFGPALDQAVADKNVAGRPLSIRRLRDVEQARECAIVYIALSGDELADALAALRGAPVLTVGDAEEFIRHGGIVAFVRADNRVSLEIDAQAAQAAGLRISSRLLSLSQMARRSSLVGARR